MTQPLNQDITLYLLNNPEFKQYIEWVSGLMADLDSVGGVEGMTNEEAGEEVRVRSKALDKLEQILAPFIEYRTKREHTVEEFKQAKSNYGL